MSRITSTQIAATLDSENPGLFRASKGLKLVTDYNPSDNINTEGVYITRPDVGNTLQAATLSFAVAVYDEDVTFNILLMTSTTNTYFNAARDAIESLMVSKDYPDFYSKTFIADETNKESAIQVEYTVTWRRTVVR
jgi:hypothetical protein